MSAEEEIRIALGAWNLRQRLSPKAKAWDNGNAAGEKGQALMEIERLVGFSGTS